jgi:hypothetical protein
MVGGDGVRKAMGPILATGVALVTAAVVVANPLAPPARDLQISTTQLSTNPEALIPFDQNLLKSISQPSPDFTFNAALAQILGALAAEADRIGTEVNSDMSIASASAASGAPPASTPLSADAAPGATPNGTPSTSTTVVAAAAAADTPIMQQVVSEIATDTAYLGNKVVDAAYAAVTAIVSTPDLIFKAVKAVLIGDLAAAFATIAQAVKAFFDPGLIIVGGIDDVIGQYVSPHNNPTPSAGAAAANSDRSAAPPPMAADTATPAAGSVKPQQPKNTGSDRRASSIDRPQPAPGLSAGKPGTGNQSHSAAPGSDRAESKSKASGPDKAGSASSGRSQKRG